MGRAKGKKLASFELEETIWENFKKKCTDQGQTASAVLVKLVSNYLGEVSNGVTMFPFNLFPVPSEITSEAVSEGVSTGVVASLSDDDIRDRLAQIVSEQIEELVIDRLDNDLDNIVGRYLDSGYIKGGLDKILFKELNNRFNEALAVNKKDVQKLLNNAVASLEDSFIDDLQPLINLVESVLAESPSDSRGEGGERLLPPSSPDASNVTQLLLGNDMDKILNQKIEQALAQYLESKQMSNGLDPDFVKQVDAYLDVVLRQNMAYIRQMLEEIKGASATEERAKTLSDRIGDYQKQLEEADSDEDKRKLETLTINTQRELEVLRADTTDDFPEELSENLSEESIAATSEELSENLSEETTDDYPENMLTYILQETTDTTSEEPSEEPLEKTHPTLRYLNGIIGLKNGKITAFWDGSKFVEDAEKIKIFKRSVTPKSLEKANSKRGDLDQVATNFLDRILKHMGYPHLFNKQDTVRIAKVWADRNAIK